jgi:hypothetical protein
MRRPIVILAAYFLTCGVGAVESRDMPMLASSGQPGSLLNLPPNENISPNFKTYALFLICNPAWLDPNKAADLERLYGQFQEFGRAIGADNVAVWFSTAGGSHHLGMEYADQVDVERSIPFCKAWKLKPSAGPHLVVTDRFPEELRLGPVPGNNYAVYKLGDMKSSEISMLLAKLTDDLVLSGKVDATVGAPASPDTVSLYAQATPLWVRLLSATQQTLGSFGCAWSFKISAGAVSADLKPDCEKTRR